MNSHYFKPVLESHRQMINSIWEVRRFPASQKEHIIPKGVVEIIFNFGQGSPIGALIGSRRGHLPKCFINGFNRSSIELSLPEEQNFFGISFQPLTIKKIFVVPAREFSDITVDLSLLDPAFDSLWHQLGEQESFNARVGILLGWLNKKIIDWQSQEHLINHFLSGNTKPDMSVTKLSQTLFYSPRHLSRKIWEATGMNTEEILHYKKYLHAVNLVHHSDLSLTEIAYQSNFSDQSHFIRSFKAYTHMTPGDYKRNKSLVKGHIYEDVR